jgi:uncharacterized membrane protein YcfT
MLARNDTAMSRTGTFAGADALSAIPRIDWVDYAKGICIVMVVMMHSTLGVELAAGHEGFMHYVVAFAKPFRMPDFFLISGLFLSRVIDRDWRTYADRKVVHFAYFYVLWVTIQFAIKAPAFAAEAGWGHVGAMYLGAFIEPFGSLWFIYLLPIFFVVTKLARPVPSWVVWLAAAGLEMLHVATGWTVIDEFAARFVYFYSGYLFADTVFRLSNHAGRTPAAALAGLALWALVNATIVHAGASEWPLVSLALGFAGALAVVVIATLLARTRLLAALRYCGEHSLVIYLAFFLPMAATRTLLLKIGIPADIGMVSAIVTTVGVVGALAIWWATRATRLNVLFARPAAFRIAPKRAPLALQAAQ